MGRPHSQICHSSPVAKPHVTLQPALHEPCSQGGIHLPGRVKAVFFRNAVQPPQSWVLSLCGDTAPPPPSVCIILSLVASASTMAAIDPGIMSIPLTIQKKEHCCWGQASHAQATQLPHYGAGTVRARYREAQLLGDKLSFLGHGFLASHLVTSCKWSCTTQNTVCLSRKAPSGSQTRSSRVRSPTDPGGISYLVVLPRHNLVMSQPHLLVTCCALMSHWFPPLEVHFMEACPVCLLQVSLPAVAVWYVPPSPCPWPVSSLWVLPPAALPSAKGHLGPGV